MKNVIKSGRFATLTLAALLTLGLSTQVFAGTEKEPTGVEIKYVGSHKNQPVLELNFNNPDEIEYSIEVVDEHNVLLYKDVVKANAGTRRFLLNTEELGNVGLRFEITGKKSNKTTVYEINRNARVVEDLVVNKVK
ncbi:MAG: hypothetical protein ACK4E0_11620 [Chitinophagaceae bacterium]